MFWNKKKKNIYMDHAATTRIDPFVFEKMKPYFTEYFYNPGSIYQEAFDIKDTVSSSRKKIADVLSARPQEIIFTDGGTEANNLVIRGLVSDWNSEYKDIKPHVITSAIEHASILETCHDLENKGFIDVDYVSVDKNGIVNIKELKELINERTLLVSVAYVNGEIGTIQDIRAIAKTIRHHRKHQKTHLPYFHTDAVQAVNYLTLNVHKLGIDCMTINGSKIYGPKKMAALYKRDSLKINPIITGGSQEYGLRAGTENVPYIVGFAEALKITRELFENEKKRLEKLQTYSEEKLQEELKIPFTVNGQESERIPNIVNISIPKLPSEEIVLRLDAVGIKASVKSACKSGEDGDSHVIRALRDSNTQSIRFSMGRSTTKKDIDRTINELVKITDSMMKTYNQYIKIQEI